MNLKFRIVPNAMPASQGEAKYLGIIIPNGVRNRALMVKNIIAREHFSESTVNAVLDAAIAETEALCAEGRDVSWGPVKFISKMHGSFPYEDSAFEDGTASVTVDAEGTNALRSLFADVVPTPMSAEEVAAAVKVSNVMDIATERFGEIHGTDEFEILGNGVTLDAEGESAKLLDRKTGETLATAETASVERGQRAVCSFAAVPGGIARGAYVLEVTTFGLVGETTPRVFRKPVTLVGAIPEPEPEPIAQTADGLVKVMAFTDGGQTATFTDGHDWTLTGEGFSDDEANPHKWLEARIEFDPDSGEGVAVTHTIAADGKSATVRRVSTASVDPGTYPNARLVIEVASETLDIETLVLPMKYVVPEA